MRRIALLVAVLAVALLPLAPAAAQEPAPLVTVQGQSQPIYPQRVPAETYRITTRHGVIYGNVERPVVPAGVKVPVILTYSPYNVLRAGAGAADGIATYFVPRGYARAVFDVVGTKDSGGCYDYGGIRERETAAAIVDALGAMEWSNGRVGMIGGSYDGTTQIAAAIQKPKHLAAIIPQVAIDRWYDYAYGGGIRYTLNSENATDEGLDTPLGFDFGFGALPPQDVGDPAAAATVVRERINPCDRGVHTENGYDPDPVYDAFWVERDYRRLAGNVTAAVLVEGGWLDHNVKHWDSTRFFAALPATTPRHLVMGQWRHSANRFPDAQNYRHAWFDRYLLELPIDLSALPAVDTEPGQAPPAAARRQEVSWPPPGTQQVALPLVPDATGAVGRLEQRVGAGMTYTDANAALTENVTLGATTPPGPATYLRFTTAPLASAVRISGGAVLDLAVTATTVATGSAESHFTPVLFDEAPDGTRRVITRGFLNTRNRNGVDRSEPPAAGVPYRAPVELWDTDWIVRQGHRLGLVVASSNAVWAASDSTRATHALAPGTAAGTGSVLRLPVSAGAEAVGAVEAPAVVPEAPSPVLLVAVAGLAGAAALSRRRRVRAA